ncbi:MAG: NAD(P)/FAD-dependent oxidoreductase [Caulobacteraceae bacterium]
MADLKGARIAVIGGGVLGLATALSVARAQAQVVLYEPQDFGDSASGVAAGMLAPAFEAVLDPLSTGHFSLLHAARDRWPSFVTQFDLPRDALDRAGAVWVARPGEDAALAAMTERLSSQGARVETLSPSQLLTLHPLLAPDVIGGVLAPQDWLLDPLSLLPAMRRAFERLGGHVRRARVAQEGEALSVDGVSLGADAVILAAGAEAPGWAVLAPELVVVTPVKGQILHLDAPPTAGPVVRASFGYVAPQGRGAVVGATMQVGLSDRSTDPSVLAELQAGAAQIFPHLSTVAVQGRAGVRASTPDGLPLVGASSRSGLLLALGARRNGWLLGPMVGEMILAGLLGEDAGPYAAALAPGRTFADAVQL